METALSPAVTSLPPPPAAQEPTVGLPRSLELRLLQRAQAGDRRAVERLVDAHIRLVYKVARRYRCRSYSLEDLVQEGVVGLMQAIRRFDPARGCRLSTYAMHWIRQAITRAVEQNDRLIHVPTHATADLRSLTQAREEFVRDHGRLPTESELSAATGIDEERIVALLGSAQDALSLETLVGHDQEVSILEMAEDPTALDPESDAVLGVYRRHLRSLVAELKPREREILEERYGFNGKSPRTLEDISRDLRVSRERVRQIEVQAMRKLRYALSRGQWE